MTEKQIRWCIRWWDDAWVAHEEHGTDPVEAPVAWEARVGRRAVWIGPHQLRDAHARGASLVDVLHEQYETAGNPFPLFMALRDAFDLESGDIKRLVSLACERDATFDAFFAKALRRAEARR
ncbi:hypothetical protein [Nannocystis pusilla]|uniref:hypothetical protein n=1 Tax=Nannocystis pusilla TaxID=889268 RepID=UPI003B7C273D